MRYQSYVKRGCCGMTFIFSLLCLMCLFSGNTSLSIMAILYVIFGLITIIKIISIRSFADIDVTGIHIKKRFYQEVHFVPWSRITKCFFIKGPDYRKPSYTVLCKNDFVLHEYPPIETIVEYRLDEAMECLVRGKISAEEFDKHNIFFLALSEKQYNNLERIRREYHRQQKENI